MSLWKIFEKAGQPGWASIVPFYNLYIMLQICNKPIWWIILFLIPIVGLVFYVLLNVAFAEKFGKSVGFAIGMCFLPFVFLPMLAFGDDRFTP